MNLYFRNTQDPVSAYEQPLLDPVQGSFRMIGENLVNPILHWKMKVAVLDNVCKMDYTKSSETKKKVKK